MTINPMSIIQTMMNQMKVRNPQGYQFVNNLMQNNGNPNAILNQVFGQIKPEVRQNILNQAKEYGVPENILAKIQNIK